MPASQFVMSRSALAGVQAVAARSGRAFARHTHDQYGIGVIRHGAQVSHSGRGQVEAGPGHVITVNPGEVHDGAPIGGERAWQMLYLDPAVVAGAADALPAARGFEFEHPAMDAPALAADLLALYALAVTGGDALARDVLLARVLARAGGLARNAPADDGAPAAIRHALGLIDDAPAAALSLADLAQACGLSRFQVLRGFSRATGMTPHAYQVQRRLLLARRLLRQGMALADAAPRAGFADQSHMTRLFTRAYGVSPGRYALAAAG